jgi:glucose/mannose transport system substrate-binding protein
MRHSSLAAVFVLLAGTIGASAPALTEELEVLHYWTSGGESKAVNVLKAEIEKKGHTWKDSAIAGGGGQNAMTVLKARAVSGNPPAVVQMRGPAVQDWAEQGSLVDLDSVAASWSKDLPPAIVEVLKYKGKIYAAPHWIHRVNWMYINKPILDKVGGKVPTTYDEMFDLADKMKAAGVIPIAHGGTAYHDGVFFEGFVQSMGIDFYRKAILEGDQQALSSPTMVKVFELLRRSQKYFDDGIQGRAWNLAAAMVIEGKAGILFMGDWAKGEFSNANKVPGKDYICAARPGTEGMFTFIADTFVFFKQRNQPASPGQLALASLIETPAYQEQAALFKGAVPALTTASVANFDDCAKKSAADMKSAMAAGTLVAAQNQGTSEAVLGAIRDVVTKFMNSNQDAASAAAALARAVKAAAS